MCKITILLLSLVCDGYGKRIQRTTEPCEASVQQESGTSSSLPMSTFGSFLLAQGPTGAFSSADPRGVSTWAGQAHHGPKTASSSSLNLMPQHAGRQLQRSSATMASATMASATTAELPPPLLRGKSFSSGTLDTTMPAWWRQNYETFQLVCAVPDGISVRDDLSISASNGKFIVKVGDTSVVEGALPHPINVDATEWLVEEDVDGFPTGARYLVVDLKKGEWWVDWPGPVASGSRVKRFAVGGRDEDAQKEATATQVAVFQTLRQLPGTTWSDLYVRPIPAKVSETEYKTLHFIGRVASDEFIEVYSAIAVQEMLIKQHARLFWPETMYPDLKDDEIELWLAPGNTEVQVASNEQNLKKYLGPPEGVDLPPVEKIGYQPYAIFEDELKLTVQRDADGNAELEDWEIEQMGQSKILKPDELEPEAAALPPQPQAEKPKAADMKAEEVKAAQDYWHRVYAQQQKRKDYQAAQRYWDQVRAQQQEKSAIEDKEDAKAEEDDYRSRVVAQEKQAAQNYWSRVRTQQQQTREKKAAQDYWSRVVAQQEFKRAESAKKNAAEEKAAEPKAEKAKSSYVPYSQRRKMREGFKSWPR